MQTLPILNNEMQRLSSLRGLQILDTPPEERFDCITRLAKEFFGVPIVLISLVEETRQWFKSVVGLSDCETSRDVSFCAHALNSRELFIIPDALTDARFADNPLVTGDPHIRFYAGCPLYAHDGSALGAFCIIDRQPRSLSLSDQHVLRVLGTWVETKINAINVTSAPFQCERDVHLRAVLDSTDEALLLLGKDQRVLMVNRCFSTFFGKSSDEIVGISCHEVTQLLKGLFTDPQTIDQLLAGTIADTQNEFSETLVQHEPQHRILDLFSVPVHDAKMEHLGRLYTFRDITKRAMMLTMLHYQARHDSLTDLPNSLFLQEKIEEILSAATPGESCALLSLSIDRFKEVNTTFGRSEGDLLLLHISDRLGQVVSASGVIARLGDDNFAILLPNAEEEQGRTVVRTLLNAFEEPFIVAGMPMQIDVSIGVDCSPTQGINTQTLLHHADVAMYEANRAHTGYAFYDPSFDQYSASRLALIEALRQAIANDTLQLYYQPKADIKTGKIYSVEALARWHHSTYGFIPPEQFIPLAEQTGLIAPLTLCVLKKALQQCQIWHAAGCEIAVAVNLSMWNLRDVTLPDTIAAFLQAYDVPAFLLYIELTETAIMTDVERIVEILGRIRALGVCVAIDDFGTGYSSLAYLKLLPVDELKIDCSFTKDLPSNVSDIAITRSIIDLAHHFGLRVVAEGVEDHDTWELLATLGCDAIQGYYLSRPIPAEKFEQWLLSRVATGALSSLA